MGWEKGTRKDSRKETESVRVTDLKKELRLMASMCLKAFDKLEKEETLKPEIQEAVSLCQQYVTKTKKKSMAVSRSAPLAELWKGTSGTTQGIDPEDNVELAREVLGDRIVSTITEEHKDPPHVSL